VALSSARGVASSARAALASARVVRSSARGVGSSARVVLSSARVVLSSARGVVSSARVVLSSARGVVSSARVVLSSARGVGSPARVVLSSVRGAWARGGGGEGRGAGARRRRPRRRHVASISPRRPGEGFRHVAPRNPHLFVSLCVLCAFAVPPKEAEPGAPQRKKGERAVTRSPFSLAAWRLRGSAHQGRFRTATVRVISTTFSRTAPSFLPSSGVKRSAPFARSSDARTFFTPTTRKVTTP